MGIRLNLIELGKTQRAAVLSCVILFSCHREKCKCRNILTLWISLSLSLVCVFTSFYLNKDIAYR